MPPINGHKQVPAPTTPCLRRSPQCGRRSPASTHEAYDAGHPLPAPLGEPLSTRAYQLTSYALPNCANCFHRPYEQDLPTCRTCGSIILEDSGPCHHADCRCQAYTFPIQPVSP